MSNNQIRTEYHYDNVHDNTTIFIYRDEKVIDKREMPGLLSSYTKKKIREEIKKEDWE